MTDMNLAFNENMPSCSDNSVVMSQWTCSVIIYKGQHELEYFENISDINPHSIHMSVPIIYLHIRYFLFQQTSFWCWSFFRLFHCNRTSIVYLLTLIKNDHVQSKQTAYADTSEETQVCP